MEKETMNICPWCGTNYLTFRSNCKNCGGPLQLASEDGASPAAVEAVPAPPPAPRPISGKYAWKLLLTDVWGIVAFVFGLVGIILSFVGAGLTLGIVTAFVGIPLLLVGLVLLVAGAAVGAWRYSHASQVVNVLRVGESARGQIVDVQKDYTVRVNRQHPSVIQYQFRVDGQDYEGKVRTLNPVGERLQAGEKAWILYLPEAPQWNSLYPHP
jgi:hypothetical protein